MELVEIIKDRIDHEGPVSFYNFMEMALYYPDYGYYTSVNEKIGVAGDYYTSCSLNPVFGAMVGKQLEEMGRILGEGPLTIVEFGAGTGDLCHAILSYLKRNPKLYNQLDYCIIEKSPVMREKEKCYLHEKVSWYDSIQDLAPVQGCILSNELVDNFSVHQVVMKEGLMEVFVGYDNGFIEILKPASKILNDYLAELEVVLPPGYRTEINLEAVNWIRDIGRSLKKGFLLTIDYGYPSYELYQHYRSCGTLICYNKHQVNDNPYQNVGKQDITTHVNFSALHHFGLKNGLELTGFTDQGHFLLSLGFKEYLKSALIPGPGYYRQEILLTNTLLTDMGSKLKVLIQHKGLPRQELSGLKKQKRDQARRILRI